MFTVLASLLGLPARLPGADEIRFSRDILPVLSDHCFACHGPDEKARRSGLRLDTREGAMSPAKSGAAAILPKDSAHSELLRRITSPAPDEIMPPPKSNRPLTPAQIETLRRWIDAGAVWGRHWAFEVPQRPTLPRTPGPHENPIDQLVQARLQQAGLSPAPEAARTTLIRRVTLDLTGLPPTPTEVQAFLEDPAGDAYERLVDRLLASPQYGERMAWDWLEAARYADSNGYQGDGERTMWPWRDWVVDAFNRNLPFDQFTLWQLAGDRLPGATEEQRLATGFLRNHMINGEGGRIPEENRIDYLFDQTETVATVWLGATFNCTRCHDHKFDPFTQRDYYGLLAFFNQTRVDGSGGDPQSPPNLPVPSAPQALRLRELETQLAQAIQATEFAEGTKFSRETGQSADAAPAAIGLPEEILGHLRVAPPERDAARLEKLAAHWKETDPGYAGLLATQGKLQGARANLVRSIPRVMVMEDQPQRRPTSILQRGNYLKPLSEVSPAIPASLNTTDRPAPADRADLARWLISPANPLMARVTANRFWQNIFGVGLVKTTDDFGLQGEKPVQAELLDWLAADFQSNGWNVKALLRRIVTSATYRQSSQVTPDRWERDPENRLLARGPRFRLPSWMIRDVALTASGLLTRQVGGAPIKTYQPPGVWEEATFGNKRYEQDHGAALYRRSLYVFWRRIVGPTVFFDVANRQTCTVKTPRTNVPLHALLTLNDTGFVEAARTLAERILEGGPRDFAEQIGDAYQRVLGRLPTEAEKTVCQRALERHRQFFTNDSAAADQLLTVGERPHDARLNPGEQAAWTLVCSMLLNLDEALTKE